MLQFIRNRFSTKTTIVAAIAVIATTSLGLFSFPGSKNEALAEYSCSNPPTVATFNPYPVTFQNITGSECLDFPLVRMRKINGGQYPTNTQEMNAGVTGSVNDELYATIYVHNGAADSLPQAQTVAKNVRVTTNVSTETGTQHTVTVTVSADNAASISQTYKVNTGSNERIEVVANSGEKFDHLATSVSSGFQMGNNTVTLGDQQACYPYAMFYRFKVRVVADQVQPQQGQLSITKEVRNINTSGSFSDQASARQNDTVEYKINVKATTATPVQNVVVTDTLNSQLEYVSGTLTLNGQPATTGLSTGGINVGTVNQNGIEFRYQAKVLASSGTVPNTAAAVGTGATRVEDTARVNVTTPQATNTTLSITKEVRNVSKGGSFATNITADNNDNLEYRIRVTNTGSATALGVQVTDSLDNTGIVMTGNMNVDRSYSGSLSNGLILGNLNVGSSIVITYDARVTRDSVTVKNTATAFASNAPQVTAMALVDVGQAPSKGNLTIQKHVRRLDGSFQKSVTVDNNSTVEYRIIVGVNSGRVTNISLTDNLPNGVEYVSGTLRVDGNSVNDNPYSINLGTMALSQSGTAQSKTVTFQARVRAQYNQATTTLTNTAIARGDNVTDVQDSATVTITQIIGNPQLAITKNVKNISKSTGFQKSVNADNNDRVQFEIVVSNPGSREVTNVRVTDNWTGNLNFNNTNVTGDFSTSATNGFSINVGTLQPGAQRRIYLEGNISFPSQTGSFNLNNTATATGDSVGSVNDSAQVYANFQGQASLQFSKRAFNDTKNVDATTVSASREDYITYTLTVTNTGNTPANGFVITDDLSGILPFADVVDLGGGTMNGQVISYPAVTVPAGGSVSKSFKVRVKFHLADNLTFTMVNVYGNEVRVNIATPKPLPPTVTPKTGAETNAIAFGGLGTAVYGLWLKRKSIWKLITNND